MNRFPFDLPDSLKSHLELFEKDQDKAIYMLERHLTRRGYDAVGYCLLGWFYLMKKEQAKALECAVKARSFAPGSPFFMHLPYYFEHPSLFDAWLPKEFNNAAAIPSLAYNRPEVSGSFFLDIDSLIIRLSRRQHAYANAPGRAPVHKKATQKQQKQEDEAPENRVSYGSGAASRTLARIYEQQEYYQKAIEVYMRLSENSKDDEERRQFDQEINRLKKLRVENSEHTMSTKPDESD